MSKDPTPSRRDEALRTLLQDAFDSRRPLRDSDLRGADLLGRAPDGSDEVDAPLSEEELRAWSKLAEAVQRLPAHPSRAVPSSGFTDRVTAAWAAEQAGGGSDDGRAFPAVQPLTAEGLFIEAAPARSALRRYGPWIAAAASALVVVGAGLAVRQFTGGAVARKEVPAAAPNLVAPSPKTPAVSTELAASPPKAVEAAPEKEKLSDLVGQLGRRSWSLAEATGSEMQDVALLWKRPTTDPEHAAAAKSPAAGMLAPWTADSKRIEDRVFQAVESLWDQLPPL